ncbi:cell shape determination protein CcmA [Chitinimonas sp. BJB300]|nr:cell shape determination protein CcmA [Chitinimonas sp. BJB300]TSJ87297.1 polymer-forming cytoskeletal protein [Chitinimonas sp. BJB300]
MAISEVPPVVPADAEILVQAPVKSAVAGESANQLIVGPNVKLKGAEILDCDTLVVEGSVEATMDSRVLRITEKGAFTGKVSIDIAEIHGHFEGELTVRQQLIVHATGRVSGSVRYGKILVEEGGELSGDVRSLATQGAARPALPKRSEGISSYMGAANNSGVPNGTTS